MVSQVGKIRFHRAVRFKSVERRLSPSATLFTTVADSTRMGGIRRKGTAPELAVRRAASNLGLRYRLVNRDLEGSPDLANRKNHWAIFVNGCFWHGHRCARSSVPTRNRAFWVAKIRVNRERDDRVMRRLKRRGYRILVIWECETRNASAIERSLRKLRRPRPRTF